MIRPSVNPETHNITVALYSNEEGIQWHIRHLYPTSSSYEDIIDEVVSELNEEYNTVKDFALLNESIYYKDGEQSCLATITGYIVQEDAHGIPFIKTMDALIKAKPKTGNRGD